MEFPHHPPEWQPDREAPLPPPPIAEGFAPPYAEPLETTQNTTDLSLESPYAQMLIPPEESQGVVEQQPTDDQQQPEQDAQTTETSVLADVAPPAGFRHNPDFLNDYEEQLQIAIAEAAYHDAPLPSFENVPTLDITPTFNPTNAPAEEIFARAGAEQAPGHDLTPHSEQGADDQPVRMWRIVERAKLEDGTGLVSSSILQTNSVGDIEAFKAAVHLLSSHEGRMTGKDPSTPFVSFSTDPINLAKDVILANGFGVKGGRDSVVVEVGVDPARVMADPRKKQHEVFLRGGVAPGEYVAAYDVADFVTHVVPEGEITTVRGDTMHRDKVLGHWALYP